ncbi:hypothetical protein FRC10_001508 [Ceratobasidium sp. 414]|nr:hypothetical protein FRC10_001508 [Ceratobasidium sp. 414]
MEFTQFVALALFIVPGARKKMPVVQPPNSLLKAYASAYANSKQSLDVFDRKALIKVPRDLASGAVSRLPSPATPIRSRQLT